MPWSLLQPSGTTSLLLPWPHSSHTTPTPATMSLASALAHVAMAPQAGHGSSCADESGPAKFMHSHAHLEAAVLEPWTRLLRDAVPAPPPDTASASAAYGAQAPCAVAIAGSGVAASASTDASERAERTHIAAADFSGSVSTDPAGLVRALAARVQAKSAANVQQVPTPTPAQHPPAQQPAGLAADQVNRSQLTAVHRSFRNSDAATAPGAPSTGLLPHMVQPQLAAECVASPDPVSAQPSCVQARGEHVSAELLPTVPVEQTKHDQRAPSAVLTLSAMPGQSMSRNASEGGPVAGHIAAVRPLAHVQMTAMLAAQSAPLGAAGLGKLSHAWSVWPAHCSAEQLELISVLEADEASLMPESACHSSADLHV